MDIKAVRKSLNLSQEQFAKKLEVSVRTIGNWEKGTVDVPLPKIEKIKALLAMGSEASIDFFENSPGAGVANTVNVDLSVALLKALDEIAAQRKLTEKAQAQMDDLISILKTR